MFYGQCNACGERWGLGTASTCTCPDLVTWDASAPLVVTPHPAFKKPWVGLTDDEIDNLELPPSGTATVRDFIRLIEAKLKEKNETA
jgi:hypothetical protein